MSRRVGYIVLLLFVSVILGSCGVTRNLPEGSYVLTRNKIITDDSVPKEERIKSSEISKFIKQKPASDIFGVRKWVYSFAKPEKDNWWNNFLRTVGSKPVILDTTLTHSSIQNIDAYINSRGFFSSKENYSFRFNDKRRTATVIYETFQGKPYRIEGVKYEYNDTFIEKLLVHDTISLIKKGDILDINVLGQERERVTKLLRNQGFYNFSVKNIDFKIDTTIGHNLANVRMIVNQNTVGYSGQGVPIRENNTIYRITQINVFPNFNSTLAATDSTYLTSLDTLKYDGLNVVYQGKRPRVSPKMLRRIINIQENSLFSDSQVNKTYDDIMRLDYFRSTSVLFNELPYLEKNEVTLVEGHWSESITTKEGELACDIKFATAPQQSYKIELEGSTTSSFYGIATTLGYQNRNIFRGAELLDVSVTFGYEFLKAEKTNNNSNTYEIGGQVALSFPQFLLFDNLFNRTGKLYNPLTRFEVSISNQNKHYYKRVLSGITMSYSWGNNRKSMFSVRPFDVNLIKVNDVDEGFLDRLQNPYLKDSYTTQMLAGISGSFLYNNQNTNGSGNSTVLRINAESKGNLISGVLKLFDESKRFNEATDSYHYDIFGIRYAQYLRGDISFSRRLLVGEKCSFAYRAFAGILKQYGNSKNSSIPYDKLFHAGGMNSMRGWMVRTLGPGGSPEVATSYPSSFGNMRLELNAEFRFPIWNMFHGAVFLDAGNVWYTKDVVWHTKDGEASVPAESIFRFNTFVPQIALNTGIGLRLNLNVIVLRLDWGIQLHNPNKPEKERWVIKDFKFRNSALNFGIGYPF